MACPEPRDSGVGVDPLVLLEAFLTSFRDGYRPGRQGSPPTSSDRVVARSPPRSGAGCEAALGDGVVRGIATGLDLRGGLILETDRGPVTVSSGEVMHLR